MVGRSLTAEDIGRLLSDPSPRSRADMAAKISTDFTENNFSDSEREMAEEIFRIMTKDAEVRVREALASHLKESHLLPHDIALTLAQDVDSVALPVLSFSEVLTDDDLAEIIRTQGEAKQVAIAERPRISEIISSALIDTGKAAVVSKVVSNEGADISEKSLGKVVETLGENKKVQSALLWRKHLPVSVAEKLVNKVSEKMQEQLLKRHQLSADMATDLILQTRERAVVSLSSEYDEADVQTLVRHLNQNNRLTSSIILRALCMGDLRFFEAALAELVQIPLSNAYTLIHDPGKKGLKRLWQSAHLPMPQLVAAFAAIEAAEELEYDGGANDRERFSRRLIEVVLTQYDDLGVEFETDDLEYLLTKMGTLPSSLQEAVES